MKYIIIALIVVTIMHDISIWRLDRNLQTLREWIEVLHGIDFDKLTKAVREWQVDGERRDDE